MASGVPSTLSSPSIFTLPVLFFFYNCGCPTLGYIMSGRHTAAVMFFFFFFSFVSNAKRHRIVQMGYRLMGELLTGVCVCCCYLIL